MCIREGLVYIELVSPHYGVVGKALPRKRIRDGDVPRYRGALRRRGRGFVYKKREKKFLPSAIGLGREGKIKILIEGGREYLFFISPFTSTSSLGVERRNFSESLILELIGWRAGGAGGKGTYFSKALRKGTYGKRSLEDGRHKDQNE